MKYIDSRKQHYALRSRQKRPGSASYRPRELVSKGEGPDTRENKTGLCWSIYVPTYDHEVVESNFVRNMLIRRQLIAVLSTDVTTTGSSRLGPTA
ncbi:hypothetical protein EVAR_67402_1 [Eumeta japonica]|uniref:Uncharacterized protein n=1 Tax=Eumeta variegata TaxID=151549 RepID=A0A4C2A108_EUMVA|nr:hypothetical protein EVAR_67402_1 [Eumeta japonica]